MENASSLIEAIVALLGALVWPIVVVFLVFYFGEPLKELIGKLTEFSLKAGDVEVKAKIDELRKDTTSVSQDKESEPDGSDVVSESGEDSSFVSQDEVSVPESSIDPSKKGRIDHRHKIEKRSKEVYLVHLIEPSKRQGQKFDVFIYLKRHRSNDLSDVSYAEFFLGRYWGNKIFKVENTGGYIGISISAYGPVLCTCRVVFDKGHEAMICRYIDLEMADFI